MSMRVEREKGNHFGTIIHLLLKNTTNSDSFPNCLHKVFVQTIVSVEPCCNNIEILTYRVKAFTGFVLIKQTSCFMRIEKLFYVY